MEAEILSQENCYCEDLLRNYVVDIMESNEFEQYVTMKSTLKQSYHMDWNYFHWRFAFIKMMWWFKEIPTIRISHVNQIYQLIIQSQSNNSSSENCSNRLTYITHILLVQIFKFILCSESFGLFLMMNGICVMKSLLKNFEYSSCICSQFEYYGMTLLELLQSK